ncbi:endospore germination permease [Peribacillus alkalitolerans]|uniref:endospore germination permease n=1 Tax=Peribacillus alkalitolerans TaxID=1550385 RepID=UPI0013D8C1B4|nr:endospore germination permease [Peribacillus alkalitolerans]
MSSKSLYNIHIFALVIMSTGFMVHVLLIPVLLFMGNRDSWISVVFSFLPSIIWIFLLYFLIKKLKGIDILTYLKTKIHPLIYYFTAILFSIYLLINAFVTFRSTVFWAKENYTFDLPLFTIMVCLSIVCLYGSIKGMQAISMMALFILPFVVFLGFFVGIGNYPNKNYSLLFPVFQEGLYSILKGTLFSSIGVFETLLILFFIPFCKKTIKIKWLILIMILLFIMTLGPLTGAIAEFNIDAAREMRVPAYDQWRLLSFGKYINRLDFLSIFQWLSGAYIRISLNVFLGNHILFGSKKKWPIFLMYLIIMGATFIPINSIKYYHMLRKFYYPFNLFFLLTFMALFLVLIIWKKPGGEQHASKEI